MSLRHKSVGTELTQAEFEASDSHEGLDASQTQPSRALDTIYQNTSGKLRAVTVATRMNRGNASNVGALAMVENATPPTIVVAQNNFAHDGYEDYSMTFFVPTGFYYTVNKMVAGTGTCTIYRWTEWEIN